MGFRFRRSVRLLPGLRLNFSGGGVSTSLGGRGATINIGKHGVRGTVGLPGTGLSYTTPLGPRNARSDLAAVEGGRPASHGTLLLLLLLAGVVVIGVAMLQRPISSSPAAVATAPAGATRERVVTAAVVNCRDRPGPQAAVVAKLTPRDALTVTIERPDWTLVTTGHDGCWVASRLIGAPTAP